MNEIPDLARGRGGMVLIARAACLFFVLFAVSFNPHAALLPLFGAARTRPSCRRVIAWNDNQS
jgi:hypothetical protein